MQPKIPRKINVMLVEDEESLRLLLGKVLTQSGLNWRKNYATRNRSFRLFVLPATAWTCWTNSCPGIRTTAFYRSLSVPGIWPIW